MSRGPQYNNDVYYHSKWKSIVNILKSQGLNINRIAQAGSRSIQKQNLNSDMDVIFDVVGDPSRESFYPKLIKVLKDNLPNEEVYPGGSYHVVHVVFQTGGKFDLVLLTKNQFDKEFNEKLEYRKNNL